MYAANDSGSPYDLNDSGGNSTPHEIVPRADRGLGLRHALAGLQAGVVGALALFACLMIGSLWDGRSIWVVPNLFATTFFGNEVYRNQLLRTSWAGLALTLAVYGLLGTIWGCIWRDERKAWLRLYGALAGLGIYFLFYSYLWRHVNPLVTLYAPDRQLQLGHVLWGLALARSPLYARRIADSTIAQVAYTEPEVRSGEVIW
jgi:hypothetical protein